MQTRSLENFHVTPDGVMRFISETTGERFGCRVVIFNNVTKGLFYQGTSYAVTQDPNSTGALSEFSVGAADFKDVPPAGPIQDYRFMLALVNQEGKEISDEKWFPPLTDDEIAEQSASPAESPAPSTDAAAQTENKTDDAQDPTDEVSSEEEAAVTGPSAEDLKRMRDDLEKVTKEEQGANPAPGPAPTIATPVASGDPSEPKFPRTLQINVPADVVSKRITSKVVPPTPPAQPAATTGPAPMPQRSGPSVPPPPLVARQPQQQQSHGGGGQGQGGGSAYRPHRQHGGRGGGYGQGPRNQPQGNAGQGQGGQNQPQAGAGGQGQGGGGQGNPGNQGGNQGGGNPPPPPPPAPLGFWGWMRNVTWSMWLLLVIALGAILFALFGPTVRFGAEKKNGAAPATDEVAKLRQEMNAFMREVVQNNRPAALPAPQIIVVTNLPTVADASKTNASTSAFGPGAAQSGNGVQVQVGNGSTVSGGIRVSGDNNSRRGWPYSSQPKDGTHPIVRNPSRLNKTGENTFPMCIGTGTDAAFTFPDENWVVSYEGNFAEIDSAFDIGEYGQPEWEWAKQVGGMTGNVRKIRLHNRGQPEYITFVVTYRWQQ